LLLPCWSAACCPQTVSSRGWGSSGSVGRLPAGSPSVLTLKAEENPMGGDQLGPGAPSGGRGGGGALPSRRCGVGTACAKHPALQTPSAADARWQQVCVERLGEANPLKRNPFALLGKKCSLPRASPVREIQSLCVQHRQGNLCSASLLITWEGDSLPLFTGGLFLLQLKNS